jgi:hypothetical protein
VTDAASRAARPLPPFAAATRGTPWLDALVSASLVAAGRPGLWAIALAGFLVRGGLLVLLLPIVVLPSPIELAASFGLDAVSISGEPTSRFVIEVVIVLLAVLAWIVVSGIVGAIVEVHVGNRVAGTAGEVDDVGDDGDGGIGGAADWIGSARASFEAPERRTSPRLVTGLLLARLVTLIPVAVALAWGARRVVDVGYREVTVPSDTATPLVVRIAQGAADALIVILVTWLVVELLLAVATRHLVFDRRQGRSGFSAARSVLRRPLPVLLAFVAGMAVSIVALAAGVLATQATWDRVQFELRAESGVQALVTVVLLVLVWGVTLSASAFLSAWRSALVSGAYLWTMEAQDSQGS